MSVHTVAYNAAFTDGLHCKASNACLDCMACISVEAVVQSVDRALHAFAATSSWPKL
jgi:hypothetical protein